MDKKFSYSQALLALAIAALAWSLFRLTLQVPDILKTIDNTANTIDLVTPKIDGIVNEVALVRAEVGKVRQLVSQQTPDILSRVDDTLPVVNKIALESEKYSAQLPSLLTQLERIEKQVTQLQKNMPDILKRVDAVVASTDNTTAEIARWRPQSLQYIDEIAQSKTYIPQYLSRIENIVDDAKTAGSEASKGMVSGFLKGVISLPFEVVQGLVGIVDINSKSAKNLTTEDVALMQGKVVSLLNDNQLNKSVWQNSSSGNGGVIIKSPQITHKKQKCHNVTFNNHFGTEQETLKELMCIDDQGLWKVM